ncbi:MAG TPA: hypothetical protein VKD72_15855 [Gemmataceae bacterium]|nr:hypothetical protein [Gemmataceae bacterium]
MQELEAALEDAERRESEERQRREVAEAEFAQVARRKGRLRKRVRRVKQQRDEARRDLEIERGVTESLRDKLDSRDAGW